MQTLDVISVNLWQIAVSLVNLLLLFLVVKKFLYKPVHKMLDARQARIDADYAAANEARVKAEADQKAYEDKLSEAHREAEGVIHSAVELAAQREKELLGDAKKKADGIVRQAQNSAEMERKKAEESIKQEIVVVSSLLTEKILEREVKTEDHRELIDRFMEDLDEVDHGTR